MVLLLVEELLKLDRPSTQDEYVLKESSERELKKRAGCSREGKHDQKPSNRYDVAGWKTLGKQREYNKKHWETKLITLQFARHVFAGRRRLPHWRRTPEKKMD